MRNSYLNCFILLMVMFFSGCAVPSSIRVEDVPLDKKSTEPLKEKKSTITGQHIIGIDISRHQGVVNFDKVKSTGVSFIFVRATDGVTYQDPTYRENFLSAKKLGITVGAYHFYETNDDPVAQITNFTDIVMLRPGDLPPVVDIERLHNKNDINVVANLKRFLDGIENHYGVKPIIYTGLNFSNKHLTEFGEYPLWVAEYRKGELTLPKGWTHWTFWQHSQSGKIDGIEVAVDLNRFQGDQASFDNLLIQE